ncbi:AAA family ATPase [Pseudomonas caspiana]
MLIVFSGLPGTGKTTIAKQLAVTTGAVYLRIDAIEQAIRNSGALAGDVGRSGYMVANELALSNLRLGRTVIIDCVNPVMESRVTWSEIASNSDVRLANIQVICSDTDEHRRRVEARTADIPGLTPPTWESVQSHEYEPWADAPFCIDTAQMSAAQAVVVITKRFLSEE